jgi:hypothetical protein
MVIDILGRCCRGRKLHHGLLLLHINLLSNAKSTQIYFRTKTKKYLRESEARIAILDASISPLQRVPKNVDSNVTICASEVHIIIVRPDLQLAQSVAALQEDGVPLPDGLEATAHENEDKGISNKSIYIL